MEMETSKEGDRLVIKVKESRLDARLAVKFKESIQALIQGGNHQVLLDLGDLQFMDSSGLGAIVSCLKTASGQNGDLQLCSVNAPVFSVFKLTRLDRIFVIHADKEAALKS